MRRLWAWVTDPDGSEWRFWFVAAPITLLAVLAITGPPHFVEGFAITAVSFAVFNALLALGRR